MEVAERAGGRRASGPAQPVLKPEPAQVVVHVFPGDPAKASEPANRGSADQLRAMNQASRAAPINQAELEEGPEALQTAGLIPSVCSRGKASGPPTRQWRVGDQDRIPPNKGLNHPVESCRRSLLTRLTLPARTTRPASLGKRRKNGWIRKGKDPKRTARPPRAAAADNGQGRGFPVRPPSDPGPLPSGTLAQSDEEAGVHRFPSRRE